MTVRNHDGFDGTRDTANLLEDRVKLVARAELAHTTCHSRLHEWKKRAREEIFIRTFLSAEGAVEIGGHEEPAARASRSYEELVPRTEIPHAADLGGRTELDVAFKVDKLRCTLGSQPFAKTTKLRVLLFRRTASRRSSLELEDGRVVKLRRFE